MADKGQSGGEAFDYGCEIGEDGAVHLYLWGTVRKESSSGDEFRVGRLAPAKALELSRALKDAVRGLPAVDGWETENRSPHDGDWSDVGGPGFDVHDYDDSQG